jgi:penicillin-binding protein 1A
MTKKTKEPKSTKSGRIVVDKGEKRPIGRRRASSFKGKILKFLFKVFFGAAGIGCILAFFLIAIYAHDLPDIDTLYKDTGKLNIAILDANENPIGSYGNAVTEVVDAKKLPPNLINALIATEDRRFYKHFGIDPQGLLRALTVNLIHGRVVQGGSTITQQLAKNVFLKADRSLKRKIQEAMLAIWLEQRYTKNEILTMYLNRVYFGRGMYGIDSAAQKYFGKPAKQMSLYESAMMAGLLKAPTTYSPQNNLRAAQRRTKQVLLNMVAAEYISKSDLNHALLKGAKIVKDSGRDSNKYYTDFVADLVQKFVGKSSGDLIVTTTFQNGLQRLAEDALVQNLMASGTEFNVGQGAILAMRPDGAILAMVGGVDYSNLTAPFKPNANLAPPLNFLYILPLCKKAKPLTQKLMIRQLPSAPQAVIIFQEITTDNITALSLSRKRSRILTMSQQ